MLDGPATFALASTPAALAPASSAARSGSCSPSANAGQRVVTSTSVGWVPGQAASTSAVAVRSMSAAAWASSAGVRRTSTLNVHRSGTVEYPWPPLIAVTVSLAGNGKPGPGGPGSGVSSRRAISSAALAMADGPGSVPGDFAGQRDHHPSRPGQPAARQAVLGQPGRHAVQHRIVRADAAAAWDTHQVLDELDHRVVVLAGVDRTSTPGRAPPGSDTPPPTSRTQARPATWPPAPTVPCVTPWIMPA